MPQSRPSGANSGARSGRGGRHRMNYLAFDLGAESGRAILGTLHDGILEVRETGRFPNEPVRVRGELHWDILRLWHEMRRTLESASIPRLAGIGIDTWGVDFALLGEQGNLLENPFHYRDARTEGMMEAVFALVPGEEIYSITGIQFLPFNTLFQLFAASRATPRLLDAADALVTVPDLLNYWLSGTLVCEYTNATTTQCVDARARAWASGLLERLRLPPRLLQHIVEPGTVIGELRKEVSRTHAGTPVIAPACHDTGSAFAAVPNSGKSALLSSGTWSLLGAELPAPVITAAARDLNFTNEGGVCGTIRLLKNIGGLWLLQSCRRSWSAAGRDFTYEELADAAARERNAFVTLFDPDRADFLNPEDMPAAIDRVCRLTKQPAPETPPAVARAILESLAFKYRAVVESLEGLTGIRFEEIRVMGGGSRNRLLNQFTADATGRPVAAGPAEATALGNIAMQMLATGAVDSLAEARRIIDRSFPAEVFRPSETHRWDAHYERFKETLEAAAPKE